MLVSGKKIKQDKTGGIDMWDSIFKAMALIMILLVIYIVFMSFKIFKISENIDKIYRQNKAHDSLLTTHDFLIHFNSTRVQDVVDYTNSLNAEVMDMKSGSRVDSRIHKFRKNGNYNIADMFLLAALVEAEAGICDLETKTAVASVVLNRVESEVFPESTIEDVIMARGEFQVVSNGRITQVEVTKESRSAVSMAMQGDTIDGALFFLVRDLSDPEALNWIDSGGFELVSKMDKDVEFYKVVD